MARIYWDRENYPVVEKLFRQAAEFCSDHDTWKLNAAHVFFMEEKFKVRVSCSFSPEERGSIFSSFRPLVQKAGDCKTFARLLRHISLDPTVCRRLSATTSRS